ncbi:hypothetical protein [Gottfriedia solisilvae]|uniref:hypothetical protein n=1 Tax=Gottfriedia solisilvae TaxID=1516104 RepID=UPI003D2F0D99
MNKLKVREWIKAHQSNIICLDLQKINKLNDNNVKKIIKLSPKYKKSVIVKTQDSNDIVIDPQFPFLNR